MAVDIRVREEFSHLPDSEIVAVWRMGFTIPDVIGLWVGESDLPTPSFICDAASRALKEGKTFYTHRRGIPELRQALIEYHRDLYGVTIEDARLAVTSAGMNAIMNITQALIGPGDNLVGITPAWPNIFHCVEIMGGESRQVGMQGDDRGWHLDIEKVFAATDNRTKAIYLASPGNPTGWIISMEDRKALLDFARQRNIAIISDEVYNRLVYDRKAAPSFLEIAEPEDPVFVVNSFSKTWCMTGWRVGWMVMPRSLTTQMERLMGFNTSGGQAFLQEGCVAAVRDGEEWVRQWVARCAKGREIVLDRLQGMNRITVIPSQASFYLMLRIAEMGNSVEFCQRMVREAKVGLAPGAAFGEAGKEYVRLCYAQSEERLHKGMDRLEDFLAKT